LCTCAAASSQSSEFIALFETLKNEFPNSAYARQAGALYGGKYDAYKSNLIITVQRKLFEADHFFDEGDYERAIEKWKEVLKIDPKNAVAEYGIWRATSKIYWSKK
jgi:tetratricopeptide (TPR) repeat protein